MSDAPGSPGGERAVGSADAEPSVIASRDPGAAEAELARMEERHKRAVADLENYRKRSAREIDRRVVEVREAMVRDWLEALDSVERALLMQPDDAGLEAVLDQMEAILYREGVTRSGAGGERFDPERHEAVATQPSARVPERTILEVARSGFAHGDRVLRPAQVVVSRLPEGDC